MNKTLLSFSDRPRGVLFHAFGLSTQPPAEIGNQLFRTDCVVLEAHCSDGSVIAKGAEMLSEMLSSLDEKQVPAYIIGLTAEAHAQASERPVRNIHDYLHADAEAWRNDATYQPRFLAGCELSAVLRDGQVGRLDAADYAHRTRELEAVLETIPAGRGANSIREFIRRGMSYAQTAGGLTGIPRVQIYTTDRKFRDCGDEGIEIVLLPCPTFEPEIRLSVADESSCRAATVARAGQSQMDLAI